jgi:hypothetical protein
MKAVVKKNVGEMKSTIDISGHGVLKLLPSTLGKLDYCPMLTGNPETL